MKNIKRALSILLAAALLMSVLTACNNKDEDEDDERNNDAVEDASEETGPVDNDYPSVDYGLGLDENGYLEGITARDLVGDFEYLGIQIPASARAVDEEMLEQEYDRQRSNFFPEEESRVTDRKVENGDLVNIDFVGSVDGVEFEGGNSRVGNSDGFNVVAGSNEFVDDFLTQIIGHSPGETFDVHVTFPEDYSEELSGKDAVFVVDINYIVDISGFKAELRESLEKNLIEQYIMNYIEEIDAEVPQSVIDALEENQLRYYAEASRDSNMSLQSYIEGYGFNSMDELIEDEKDNLERHARTQIVLQAIAEDLELFITEEDLNEFLSENGITLEEALEMYPMPYLKQMRIHDVILNLLIDEAVLLEGNGEGEDGEEVGDEAEAEAE